MTTLRTDIAERIATVTLDRPKSFNALDPELLDGLAAEMARLAQDASVRAVVLTGAGKAFCAGGDLAWMLAQEGGAGPAVHRLAGRFHEAVIEIRRMPKPVIAAVNGVAAGGGFSLALSCDLRVMARGAELRQAYTAAGLSLDGGGSFMLPRLVGLGRALEIVAFDQPIGAARAVELGLATRVADDAVAEALAMARQIAGGSASSFAECKRLLNISFDNTLETQLEDERRTIAAAAASADGREGLRAFSEKRRPKFA
jgi:2-(1,2-epoxy-1,2-dihydrophenyl)acetyl-CoA isomerase